MLFVKKIYKNVSNLFMNLSITLKMVFIYVFIFIIPAISYMAFLNMQSSKYLIDKYLLDEQRIMEQEYANLKIMTSQCEGVFQLVQNNTSVLTYLSGNYESTSKEIVDLLYKVRPTLNYIAYSNKNIDELLIYKNKKSLVDTSDDVISLQGRNITNPKYYQQLESQFWGRGKWIFEKSGKSYVFRYYCTITDSTVSHSLGLMRLTVKAETLLNLLKDPDKNVVRLFKIGGETYTLKNSSLQPENNQVDYNKDSYLHNTLEVNNLGLVVDSYRKQKTLPLGSRSYTQTYFIFIVLILTLIYFIFVTSIVNRLRKFQRHMRDNKKKELDPFEGDTYKDEIGLLIKVYNDQILRIETLNREVLDAQVKKQIADYYVLRAQIKPHFIYNAMETIRMMADINNDSEVADLTYDLGRYIRYNLSRNVDGSFLIDEVENITHYLEIYKTSMAERLEYKITLDCDIKNVPCPGFILQPLVENAIHHAVSNEHKELFIDVVIRNDGLNYTINIADNGTGIEAEKLLALNRALEGHEIEELKQEAGIGLLNVAKSLRSFDKYSYSNLYIDSQPGQGTVCKIQIALKEV